MLRAELPVHRRKTSKVRTSPQPQQALAEAAGALWPGSEAALASWKQQAATRASMVSARRAGPAWAERDGRRERFKL
jgi:hypothetical protein